MNDVVAALLWYVSIGALAVLVWPIAGLLFPPRSGCGWGLTRAVSGPLVVYLAWLIASLHILSWGMPALSASLLLVIGASVLAYRAGWATPKAASWRENAGSEVVYGVFFAATLLIRSLKPELCGLEKLMDWGFINALLITESIPPADPWFAGATINYYYFGHAVAAGLITLSHVPPKFGYNLMFAHVLACAGIGIFELSRMLLPSFGQRGVFRTNIFAAAGALLVVFGGNFHFIIYGWIRPRLQLFGLVSPPALPYRFSNSARFIGYDPPT